MLARGVRHNASSRAPMETGGRTVVVSGVPDVLPAGRMADKLTVHFQSRRRSHGGDVEAVRFPTDATGVAFVTFDEAKDAERAARKEEQIMADGELPRDYLLTVYPLTRDVFPYVSNASVDLSAFGGDQAALIQSLRSAHRSVRFQPLPQQRRATVEGPFAAIQALRADLVLRAGRLTSASPPSVRPKQTPVSRARSHLEFGSLSCGGSKADVEAAGPSSLPTPARAAGKSADFQSLLSRAENTAAADGGPFEGSFAERLQRAAAARDGTGPSRIDPGAARAGEAEPRQAMAEPGVSAEIRSFLSGLDRLPAEGRSAKAPGGEQSSRRHSGADGFSGNQTTKENQSRSGYGSAGCWRESHQSGSAVGANLLQTRIKDAATSSETDTEDAEELPGARPDNPKDRCIWVDSDTFRYIQKFHKRELDKCLRSLDASAESDEEMDLTQISLTLRRSSRAASRFQQNLENLEVLVEFWQSTLRVHWIHFNEDQEAPEKETLIQICEETNFLFDDVLYEIMDCCIKVIGPSVSSHLFYTRVKDRIGKLP